MQPTGICRHAANLARCLADVPQIKKITVLVGKWQEEYFHTAFDIDWGKVELVPIAIANNSLARNRWFAFGLPQAATKYEPDLVHLSFPVPVFRSRFRCPVVASVHDLYPYAFPETFGGFNSLWKRVFFKRCMESCDGVACVSQATMHMLDSYFPELQSRVPVRVIHNYAEFVSSSATVVPIESEARPFLLTVAQHQRNKRLDVLLHAFHRLRSQGLIRPELNLLVVGSLGAETDRLLKLASRLNIKDSVRWVAPISDQELAWLYKNCELFVASSCIEGFCLPLLEALYFSCRVVASDIPVFREVAGDENTFFDISRTPVENLACAIDRSLRGDRIVNRSGLRFSKRNTAADCLSLYSLVLPEVALPGSTLEPVAYSSADATADVIG